MFKDTFGFDSQRFGFNSKKRVFGLNGIAVVSCRCIDWPAARQRSATRAGQQLKWQDIAAETMSSVQGGQSNTAELPNLGIR